MSMLRGGRPIPRVCAETILHKNGFSPILQAVTDLVRGSSRRIMSLRFRPAYISVINRRASAEAVISPAVQNPLKAHQRDHVPAPPPVDAVSMPERCSPSRVRSAAPNYGAPLTAARRSGQMAIATGGSGGNMRSLGAKDENQNPVPESLTRSLHISFRMGRRRTYLWAILGGLREGKSGSRPSRLSGLGERWDQRGHHLRRL